MSQTLNKLKLSILFFFLTVIVFAQRVVPEVSKYVGNGVPAWIPTAVEPKIAQGLSSPYPIYYWNGTIWVKGNVTEVLNKSGYTFPTAAFSASNDQLITTYPNGAILTPVLSSNIYTYMGEYNVVNDLLVATTSGTAVINFDKAIKVKSNGDRFKYDLVNNTWIPELGYITRTTATMPTISFTAATATNEAETVIRVKNTTDGNFYKWNGTAFVVETTDAETKVITANPTTALAKFGDLVMVQTSGGDTSRLQYLILNRYEAQTIKSANAPSLYVISGTQTIDNTKAIWERPLSTVSGVYTKFVLKNKTWKPQSELTIEDFGADSLSLNNTAAIQKAIDSAYVNGNKVIVPKGTFLASTLNIYNNNVQFVGIGTIKLINNTNAQLLKIYGDSVTIKGITFHGNKTQQTTTDNVLGSVVYSMFNADFLTIEDCFIIKAKRNGLSGDGINEGHKYYRNYIYDCDFIGIQPNQGSGFVSRNLEIAHNTIRSCGQDGIGTTGMVKAKVFGNHIYDCTIAGISFEAHCDSSDVFENTYTSSVGFSNQRAFQVNDCVNVTFSNNHAFSAGALITAAGGNQSYNIKIQGNTCDSCGGFDDAIISINGQGNAFSYANCYDMGVIVENNILTNNKRSGITLDAIKNVVVRNNIIKGINLSLDTTIARQKYGIYFRTFAHNNLIENNIIEGNNSSTFVVGIGEINDGANTPSFNTILQNKISNVDVDILVAKHGTNQSTVTRPIIRTIPTNGTYLFGQSVAKLAQGSSLTTNTNVVSEGTLTSTSNQTTGSATVGAFTITLAKGNGYTDNMFIRIAGAGVSGADLVTQINRHNPINNQFVIVPDVSTNVTNAVVTIEQPTFSSNNPEQLETQVLAANPTTALYKSGDIAVVETSGGDTVRIQQLTTTKIKALGGKMTTLPSVYTVSGTQTIDYSEATIEVGGLNYKVNKQSNKWGLLPDQTAALASFPDATLSTLDLRKTSLISSTDSAEYKVKTLQGTTVQRWHRVSDIIIRNTGVMPSDSVLAGSQYIYNRGADVKRYGLNTNSPDASTRYVSTDNGGWQPIKGELNATDFGLLTATTNKQRRVALQTMVDSSVVTSGIKQGFIQCNIPQGDFMLDSTLHLGYGFSFNQLILKGSGRSYRGQGFTGTVLRIATSDQQIIDISGSRGTIVQDMTLVGLNDYTVPTGSNRSNGANYVKSGLNANADSRYAPHAGITLDGYSIALSGSKPTPAYPDIRFPSYDGHLPTATYTQTTNSSAVVVKNVMFFNLIVGIVSQPGDSDGNGDFTKIEFCQFDNCKYDVSVGQTQARNTLISNCEGYGEYTCFTTSTHGRQNGRINLLYNYSGGGSYQVFDIRNISVNGTMLVDNLYVEDCQRVGNFLHGNSSPIIFNGGAIHSDEQSSPSSGVVANTLVTTGIGSIIFNGFAFVGQKHVHFHNDQTKIKLNSCVVIGNVLNGEVSGVSATDTQRLGFRRATKGVTASDMYNLEVNNCKASTYASLYAEDNNYFGNSRLYSNDNFNRMSIHDYKDYKPVLGIFGNSVFNADVTWARNVINNLNCNYVERRFAFGSNAAFVRQGWNKGDAWQTTEGLVFVCEESRSDSLILTLMNNYTYSPTTGAFTGYVNAIIGGAGSPLAGNLYWNSCRLFMSPMPIYGFFTAGSYNVTGLKDQRGNAYNTSNIDLYTPLYGGQYNGLYPYLDNYNSVSYRINSSDIKMTDIALRTGWFPVGNTFGSRFYSFIDAERALTSSATIPTIAGNLGDFVLNSTSGTSLLGWRNTTGGTTWTPVYINNNDILTGSVAFNSAITAGAEGTATATITGAAVNDVFGYSLGATDLPTGVVVKSVRVTAANTVVVTLTNTTASTQTPNVTIYFKR